MPDDWSWTPDETGLDDDDFPHLDFGLDDEDEREVDQWIAHLEQQICWLRLSEPIRGSDHRVVTHEGFLDIPGCGCVRAYLLDTMEVVYDPEELQRLLLRVTGEDAP